MIDKIVDGSLRSFFSGGYFDLIKNLLKMTKKQLMTSIGTGNQ